MLSTITESVKSALPKLFESIVDNVINNQSIILAERINMLSQHQSAQCQLIGCRSIEQLTDWIVRFTDIESADAESMILRLIDLGSEALEESLSGILATLNHEGLHAK